MHPSDYFSYAGQTFAPPDLTFAKYIAINIRANIVDCRFSVCTKLEFLNLSHNSVGSLNWISSVPSLRVLILDYNPICRLRSTDFQHTKLSFLSLRFCRVENASEVVSALSPLRSLKCLYFNASQSSLRMGLHALYPNLSQSMIELILSDPKAEKEIEIESEPTFEDMNLQQEIESSSSFDMREFNLADHLIDYDEIFDYFDDDDIEALNAVFDSPFIEIERTRELQRERESELLHGLPESLSFRQTPASFVPLFRELLVTFIPSLIFLDDISVNSYIKITYKERVEKKYLVLPSFSNSLLHALSLRAYGELGSSASRPYSLFNNGSLAGLTRLNKTLHLRYEQMYTMGEHSVIRPSSSSVRQFEYNPNSPEHIILSEVPGSLSVYNHVKKTVVSDMGNFSSNALGLSWLNKPSNSCFFLSGFNGGDIYLWNINKGKKPVCEYSHFPELTSLSSNCEDTHFLTTGYQKSVCLYDIESAQVSVRLENIHKEHVNIGKFARNNRNLFATSSYDETAKIFDMRMKKELITIKAETQLVHLVFSNDDQYLLLSGVDNDVIEYHLDGRIHLRYPFQKLSHTKNYRRSYYNCTGDLVFCGSVGDNVLRIACTRTGKILREIPIRPSFDRSGKCVYIQSVRPHPFEPLLFTCLAGRKLGDYFAELIALDLTKQFCDDY